MDKAWNHNIQYHQLVLAAVPAGCGRALDVGCARGLLTQQLAPLCGEVVGIDLEAAVLPAADSVSERNVAFVTGDVMTYPFEESGFDFVASVATLHHLQLSPALRRFRALLRPGGALVVVGLYRPETAADYLFAAAGRVASWTVKRFRPDVEQTAPMAPPRESLREIRLAVRECLPEAVVTRRLFFRYTLVWRKPVTEPVPGTATEPVTEPATEPG